MPASTRFDPQRLIGREPDRLSLEERHALAGKWMALEIYTPETLPLRRMAAIGDSIEDCMRQLRTRELDPRQFEYQMLRPPY